MSRSLVALGLALLGTAAVGLTAVGAVDALTGASPVALGGVAGLAVLGQLRVVRAEGGRLYRTGTRSGFGRGDALTAGAVVAGALVTYPLSVDAGLGPVVAAALVGIVAPFVTDYDVPAYCGAFVGMASESLVGYGGLALAAVVAGVAYVVSGDAFGGFGGKLGTVAFVGCTAAVAATGAGYPEVATDWRVGWPLLLVTTLAAVATYLAHARLGYSVVLSSGAVGLAGGLLLPAAPRGGPLAAAAFCATFAGMSSVRRLPTVVHAATAGLLCGVLFAAVAARFPGSGGKLGTVAFAACLGVYGVDDLRSDVRTGS
ncbi:hypothetical protein G9464_13805 [Halostella sp. JP-L12]|uniref:hypothetical protein n=1 Tax=Halostella TaxID=1843185 RepID=UPI000EF77942|nr:MULTISPECIES: hypothetical protein [Halostella]NHN48661.1 hypothetical protein [Halostella sp. JP-L12]